MSYEEIRASLCLKFGWLPGDVDDMPFDIIDSMWREGKPVKSGIPVSSEEEVMQIRRNWRNYIG